MYRCVRLCNKNFLQFKKLNDARLYFNSLNEDFFQSYDAVNFFRKLLMKKRVKLLIRGDELIGYIWIAPLELNNYNINSMYVHYNEDIINSSKYIIDSMETNATFSYEIESDSKVYFALKEIGFKEVNSTIELMCSMYNNISDFNLPENITFQVLKRNLDEKIRCKIQNEVFDKLNRIPLKIDDIYYDENQNYYYDKGAIFIKQNDLYLGYGQIIIENNEPTIVNLGILKEYRGRGYGKALLMHLLKIVKDNFFNNVYIKVDSKNQVAIGLYKSLNFKTCKSFSVLQYKS